MKIDQNLSYFGKNSEKKKREKGEMFDFVGKMEGKEKEEPPPFWV